VIGTTASVVSGKPGTAQLESRATGAALPFKPGNRRIDVSAL
jgi:vanillate/3-O-methylgallate O-demethylase